MTFSPNEISDIASLNERFGVDGTVRFGEGINSMPKVELTFDAAKLELYLQGAAYNELPARRR